MPLVKVLHHDLPSVFAPGAASSRAGDFFTRRRLLRADQLSTGLYPKDFVSSRWVSAIRSRLGPLVGGLFDFCGACVGGGGPAGQESQGFLVGCVGFGGEHVEP